LQILHIGGIIKNRNEIIGSKQMSILQRTYGHAVMSNEEIKKQILEAIVKTELIIQEYEELTKPIAPDVAVGRLSRMDAINNKSVTEAALREARSNLSKLKVALSKVGTPGFGVCIRCQKPIPVGRLLIRPESQHCVGCAQ
jgi:DnaK suppressor protein